MIRRSIALFLLAWGTPIAAQWLNYPAPGVPRLPDGTPNLSAPVPRTAEGKPDLDGIWFIDETPLGQFGERPVASRYELNPEDVVLTPEGEAQQRRLREHPSPATVCLPMNIVGLAAAQPLKILSNKGVVAILYEVQTTYRQIFTDGRALPHDPNPAWRGYSVGKWDGDTLVVDTTGFNDQSSILPGGLPHSESLHIIERFRRYDFGHLEIQFTIDDSNTYVKPWSIKEKLHLTPDTELLEYFCNENEKDLRHIVSVDK